MSGLFEVLASTDAVEQNRIASERAVVAAQTRAEARFSKFVAQGDTEGRLAYLETELRKLAGEVADEYGASDVEGVYLAAREALGGGHPSGCTCGFCKNKGKLPGSKSDDDADDKDDDGDEDDKKESSVKTACDNCEECSEHCTGHEEEEKKASTRTANVQVRQTSASAAEFDWDFVASVHTADGFSFCKCNCEGCNSGNHCESEECIATKHSGNPGNPDSAKSSEKESKIAADVETGDTFAQERQDLPKSDGTGLGDTGAVPTDKSKSGDNLGWDLKPIDVPSNFRSEEEQQIHDTPDYKADLPGVSETGKSISADAPLQPEHNVADRTETWTGTEGQANPVTSKWSVINT